MQINGLLVTLAAGPHLEQAMTARHLGARPELTLGPLMERWLPVAMEAADDAHAREIHDWISAQPGVEFVDVVSVSFDDEERGCVADQPQLAGPRKSRQRVEDDTAALPRVPFPAPNA